MAPPPDLTPRSARLRALIDDLILFGRILIETLQREPDSAAATRIISRFSTRNIAAIIARITRGLMLAAALDDRLVRSARRIDNPPPPRPDDTRSRSARQRPARSAMAGDDAALLARMPTAAEIAANIRNRPIGDVLADIAHDLGLVEPDPLWWRIYSDIQRAYCGTGLVRLLRPMLNAGVPPRRERRQPPPRAATPSPVPDTATGPPIPIAA
jgi:hypothetical protein